MIIDSTSTRRARPTVATLAAASLALLLGAGCIVGEQDADLDLDGRAKIQCPAVVEEWTPTISYKAGDVRTFNGAVFQCRTAHTPASNWNPIDAASLWLQVDCINDPATPPPVDPPDDNGGDNGGGDNGGGEVIIGAGGVFDADIKALIDERFFILNISATSDPARNFTQVTNVGRAGMQDIKALIAVGTAKVTTSNVGGVEEVVVTVGAERRLQIRRTKARGLIEGVMVGAATDAKAPFAMSVGSVSGVLTHTLVVDVGNNLKNDLRGQAPVNNLVVETGGADSTLQLNGGLRAFPEGAAIVNALAFPGLKGF